MSETPCYYVTIYLIVTGEGERDHLPELFSTLSATGLCHFKVLRKANQLTPRALSRRLEMVGSRGSALPTKAESEISIPTRLCLRGHHDRLVLLIDDLEHARRDQAEVIFSLYREALDKLLIEKERQQAAMHFLVNMLEAYFFAHAQAVEEALGVDIDCHEGDVEHIRHPKGELKSRLGNYRERRDGGAILEHLKLDRVLADPATCTWLRACVAWLVEALRQRLDPTVIEALEPVAQDCHLEDGQVVDWLRKQRLPEAP